MSISHPGVQVGGGSAVMRDIKTPKAKLLGRPVVDFGLGMKITVLQQKLPDLFKRVGRVEKLLEDREN